MNNMMDDAIFLALAALAVFCAGGGLRCWIG